MYMRRCELSSPPQSTRYQHMSRQLHRSIFSTGVGALLTQQLLLSGE